LPDPNQKAGSKPYHHRTGSFKTKSFRITFYKLLQKSDEMIIDVHTHLNNYDKNRSIPLTERLGNLLQNMESNEIDCCLVLTSYYVDEHRPSIKEVIEATKDLNNIHVIAGISYLDFKEQELR